MTISGWIVPLGLSLALLPGGVSAQMLTREAARPATLSVSLGQLSQASVNRGMKLTAEQARAVEALRARLGKQEAVIRQEAADPLVTRARLEALERATREELLPLLSAAQKRQWAVLEAASGVSGEMMAALVTLEDATDAQLKELRPIAERVLRQRIDLFYRRDFAATDAERNAVRVEEDSLEAQALVDVLRVLTEAQSSRFRAALKVPRQ